MPPKATKNPQRARDMGESDPTVAVNAIIVDEMVEIRSEVLSHPVFAHAESGDFMDFAGGASQAPFILEDYKIAMGKNGTYRCGAPETWLDFTFSVQSGIPYNRKKIYELAEAAFYEPGKYTGTHVVLVQDMKYNPLEHKGAWCRISPEEPCFARFCGIRHRIDNGATDAELRLFLADIKCASIQFEFHGLSISDENNTVIPRAINLREQMKSISSAVGRDSLQRQFEVVKQWKKMEDSPPTRGDDVLSSPGCMFFRSLSFVTSPSGLQ